MYSEQTTVDYKKGLKTIITEYTYRFYLLQNTEKASSSSPKESGKFETKSSYCDHEVLFENHIFYEKVSSIKMIIIITTAVQHGKACRATRQQHDSVSASHYCRAKVEFSSAPRVARSLKRALESNVTHLRKITFGYNQTKKRGAIKL